MKLPQVKKILREDVKDVSDLIDPLNNNMETNYQALNKNITFLDNIACFVKELVYNTPSTYPTMDNVEFMSTLKTKAIGCWVMQVYEKSTYTPPAGPVWAPWVENNGTIVIGPITGLAASKTYIIRLVVT